MPGAFQALRASDNRASRSAWSGGAAAVAVENGRMRPSRTAARRRRAVEGLMTSSRGRPCGSGRVARRGPRRAGKISTGLGAVGYNDCMKNDLKRRDGKPTVTFWGAAQSVTGSMHLVEAGPLRVLLDCGLTR